MSSTRNTWLRPLTARSVIASTLLGMDRPRLPAAALVASGEKLGVAPGTTRVALSRMVETGELRLEDGVYTVAGPLAERHARQVQGLHPRTRRWNGDWRIGVVASPSRTAAQRSALRTAMGQLRFAELREGVWLRPDNIALESTTALSIAREQCTWMTGSLDEQVDVDKLFTLPEWSGTARELLRELGRTVGALEQRDADALGETFLIAAATTRHLTLDPLLPRELLPPEWPGEELRHTYDRYQAQFAATWRAWYRSMHQEPLHP